MPTLKDLASLTGVSVNTVSRALRDMPDIGEATKERIKRAAELLGYRPNTIARGLVLKRTFIIGALVTEIKNPYRSGLLQALRALLTRDGYHLLIESFEIDAEVGERIREMTSRGVDGLLIGNIDGILAEKEYWPDLQAVRQANIPLVTFFNAITSQVDSVALDHSAIAEQLTRHLIEAHGRQEILYVGGHRGCSRTAGYLRAMQNAGLDGVGGFVSLPYWDLGGTRDGIVERIARHGAPEGIVCHNDLTAIGVMAGLRQAGVRVPEDVAVVGTDNIEVAGFTNPTLTTAGVKPAVVAQTLVSLLMDQIECRTTGRRRVELPFEVFLRESCGCSGT